MKKIILVSLVMLLSLTLISCSDSETKKTTDENKGTEEKADSKVVEEKKDTTLESSKKQTYIDKLDKIKVGLKDLDKLYAGNTLEMKGAAGQEYDRWDVALNEIYGVLKTQLSTSEMSALEKEEVQWIKDKEEKAKKASLEFQGGTGESLAYTSSLATTTKERCYELVNKYMK